EVRLRDEPGSSVRIHTPSQNHALRRASAKITRVPPQLWRPQSGACRQHKAYRGKISRPWKETEDVAQFCVRFSPSGFEQCRCWRETTCRICRTTRVPLAPD